MGGRLLSGLAGRHTHGFQQPVRRREVDQQIVAQHDAIIVSGGCVG
jgi:hypothetical protein